MGYTVQKYQLTLDQAQFPNLNPAQFGRMCDIELGKFIQKLLALDCEFVALQDLTNLNIATRFFKINEYHAVRQLTNFDLETKSLLVIFDATALLNVEAEDKLPGGSTPTSSNSEVTPGVTAATETLN